MREEEEVRRRKSSVGSGGGFGGGWSWGPGHEGGFEGGEGVGESVARYDSTVQGTDYADSTATVVKGKGWRSGSVEIKEDKRGLFGWMRRGSNGERMDIVR
jgi:hypothetical protein